MGRGGSKGNLLNKLMISDGDDKCDHTALRSPENICILKAQFLHDSRRIISHIVYGIRIGIIDPPVKQVEGKIILHKPKPILYGSRGLYHTFNA